jgi:hypothetical protein
MTHPKLDRRVSFDERSRSYPIRALLAPEQIAKPRGYTWRVYTHLDQGQEGACVGFAWAQELAARPAVVAGVTNEVAEALYRQARYLDEWPGEDYDGTSVIAGAKAVTGNGYMPEYRWAFGLQDLILAIGYKGPAVLGINWYTGMFDPDSDGLLHVTGQIEGGHAILADSVNVKKRLIGLWNSWGPDWSPINGAQAYVGFDDMQRLLDEQGEACVPVQRVRTP